MKLKVCPYCQAHLDWGERCPCQDEKEAHDRESENDEQESQELFLRSNHMRLSASKQFVF